MLFLALVYKSLICNTACIYGHANKSYIVVVVVAVIENQTSDPVLYAAFSEHRSG